MTQCPGVGNAELAMIEEYDKVSVTKVCTYLQYGISGYGQMKVYMDCISMGPLYGFTKITS